MRYKLVMCFQKELNLLDEADSVYHDFVKFEPRSITLDTKTKLCNGKTIRKYLKNNLGLKRITIENEDNLFVIGETSVNVSCKVLHLEQHESLGEIDEKLVEKYSTMPYFVSAFIVNADYEEIQSEVFSNNISFMNYEPEILESIKNTPWIPEMWGGKEYDVTFNPGSSALISYTWLIIGWKMWFGNQFYKLVDKEKILNFTNAISVKELTNNRVFIQLYEDIRKPYLKDAVDRQWKWKDWIQFNQLAKEYG